MKKTNLKPVSKELLRHALTIAICAGIVTLGTIFIAHSSPGTTSIGENINASGTISEGGQLLSKKYDPLGAAMKYVDRGDPSVPDFTLATLISDSAYRDLDLSGIVPAEGANKLVTIIIRKDTDKSCNVSLKETSHSNDINTVGTLNSLSGSEIIQNVLMDSSRKISYKIDTPNSVGSGWFGIGDGTGGVGTLVFDSGDIFPPFALLPIVPGSVILSTSVKGAQIKATDDGAGHFIDTTEINGTTSSIDYATGAFHIVFKTGEAPDNNNPIGGQYSVLDSGLTGLDFTIRGWWQ